MPQRHVKKVAVIVSSVCHLALMVPISKSHLCLIWKRTPRVALVGNQKHPPVFSSCGNSCIDATTLENHWHTTNCRKIPLILIDFTPYSPYTL
jgi:hypothetical protein